MPTRIDINNNILTWAIDRAGYDLDAFLIDYPKAAKWLEEQQKPTVRQLEQFARKVHLPFGYLLLNEPPVEKLPIPFFRTEKGAVEEVPLNVFDTISYLQQRQDWLIDFLEDNDAEPLDIVGKFQVDEPLETIVTDMREALDLTEDWARQHRTWWQAINHLTERIESIGVIVTFNSIVGNNNRRSIKVEDCRGFVLVHPLAPFLFVNSADAKSAQIFTLIHELAHIWLGESAGFDFAQLAPADDPVEIKCNEVAVEFLVPRVQFEEAWEEAADFIKLSRIFKVSPIVIGRRALDLGKIDKVTFFKFYNAYTAQWRKDKKEKQSSGGDFYATARKRISPTFAAYIKQAVLKNTLLYRDAYKLTGLKGDTFAKFMANN